MQKEIKRIWQVNLVWVFALILAFIIGVNIGVGMTIQKVVDTIPIFANVTIDYKTVNDALFRYQNQIGGSKCSSSLLPGE